MWRKFDGHKQETKAVKVALAQAWFKGAKVGHGTGTAWAWLHVKVAPPPVKHQLSIGNVWTELSREEKNSLPTYERCVAGCKGCEAEETTRRSALSVVLEATGRGGQYGGEVNLSLA